MSKKRILQLFSVLLIIALSGTLFSKFHWLFDMLAHFRVYYWFGFIGLTLFAVYLKERIWTIIHLFFVVFIGFGFLKFYIPSSNTTDSHFRVCSMNILSSNDDFQKTIELIEAEKPDILVVQELSPIWATQLQLLHAKYPYQKVVAQAGNFGLGIYSKFPMKNTEIEQLCALHIPTIITDIEIENKTITLIGTHPMPPLLRGFDARNEQFKNLNMLVNAQQNPVVLVGDLNCTSFSNSLDLLTDNTDLKDTRLGFGWQPTWPATIPVVSLAIDHCFVSENLTVVHRKVGNSMGSDHYPIIVDIGW